LFFSKLFCLNFHGTAGNLNSTAGRNDNFQLIVCESIFMAQCLLVTDAPPSGRQVTQFCRIQYRTPAKFGVDYIRTKENTQNNAHFPYLHFNATQLKTTQQTIYWADPFFPPL
jgi:hypothetical protein